MKKIVAFLTVLVLLYSAFPGAAYAAEYDGKTQTLSAEAPLSADLFQGERTVSHLIITKGTLGDADFQLIRSQLSNTLETFDFSAASVQENALPPDALRGMQKLKSVELPRSLASIGSCAFYGCEQLLSITLPPSVTKIEWGAFAYCFRLAELDAQAKKVELPYYNNAGVRAFTACALDLSKFETDYSMFGPEGQEHFRRQMPKPLLTLSATNDRIRKGEAWAEPTYEITTAAGASYNQLVQSGEAWLQSGMKPLSVIQKQYRYTNESGWVDAGDSFATEAGFYLIEYTLSNSRFSDSNQALYRLMVEDSGETDDDEKKDTGDGNNKNSGNNNGNNNGNNSSDSSKNNSNNNNDSKKNNDDDKNDKKEEDATTIDDLDTPLSGGSGAALNPNGNPSTGR